ncbi:alpha/beta fold hydrolase [Aquabacterium sp. J223]|uniref:alpha/beta fold hydrolase n=1 Tax=Aquabacterium sp. J223 TaxID=2898431 RepID=UPI0021ADC055|nr:alpha/beta hydrolase [Aquabacterium sp. J223]UUX94067.1 alpha/beta hydrolase [Aquabacterium sp. J223]
MTAPYPVRRPATDRFLSLRGWRHHLLQWGEPSMATPQRPPLMLLHGWMDVAASFQFMVDALAEDRFVLAFDWRGFGLSEPDGGPLPDSYSFCDYLGDLEAVLTAVLPDDGPLDLLGHSMGGNVAMLYAGVRPQRVRRLVNLEGFGQPGHSADETPRLWARWLDALRTPQSLRPYPSVDDVAARLRANNPRLPADKAAWLAPHWSRQDADGLWRLLSDPAHKRPFPEPYRVDEVLACWRAITAPVLWVEGAQTDTRTWWGDRYPREAFESRIAQVARLERHTLQDCAHMLHHDQPRALAQRLEAFLGA